jgi:hypothetical protein
MGLLSCSSTLPKKRKKPLSQDAFALRLEV